MEEDSSLDLSNMLKGNLNNDDPGIAIRFCLILSFICVTISFEVQYRLRTLAESEVEHVNVD